MVIGFGNNTFINSQMLMVTFVHSTTYIYFKNIHV
jgi:hypothetical protein